MVTRRTIRRGLAGPVALGVLAVLPGVAAADAPPTYAPATDAKPVVGKPSTGVAPKIVPGTYTDSLERGEKKLYALELDGSSTAYVSAVAAPAPDTKVEDYTDGLTVSVQDSNGTTCGPDGDVRFHGGKTAYPIADYASRRIGSDLSECQQAGPYYVVVERPGEATSGPDSWPVELHYMTEPGLTGAPPAEPGKGSWSSATPPPPTEGARKSVAGGTGFNDAASVGEGQWQDRIRPGETRFYRVPVDWGQQLNVSAELSSTARKPGTGISSFVPEALGLTAYNPARGLVSDESFKAYEGKQTAVRLFTAPVDYGNRFSDDDAVSPMRFAGWYYLEVSLNPDAAQFFKKGADLTLRVGLKGAPKPGPQYAEPAADFAVTSDDRNLAATGRAATEAERNGHLRTVGYAGIGVGAALLVGLGVWTVTARRRAAITAAATGPAAGAPGGQGVPVPGQRAYGAQNGAQGTGQGPGSRSRQG